MACPRSSTASPVKSPTRPPLGSVKSGREDLKKRSAIMIHSPPRVVKGPARNPTASSSRSWRTCASCSVCPHHPHRGAPAAGQ
eukprot:scaffold133349_cov37-Tisochrysis_lutea.AAC.1